MVLYKHITNKLRWVYIVALSAVLLMAPAVVAADDYNVTAVVPYPAPTHAAVIDPTLNGVTVADAAQTITGSCELLSPEGFVAIWRGGVSIGSSVCNGSFSIPILLQQGQNVLIARSASASGLYGPDSSPVTVTLNLPVNVPPAVPPTSTIPTNVQTLITDTNAGIASGLTVTTATPFGVLNADNQIAVRVIIGGGEAPYNLSINWGDGSVEAHSIPTAGVYDFTHIYSESKAYIVHGVVQDTTGAIAQCNYAALSLKKPAGGIFSPILNQPPIDYIPEAIVAGTFVLLICDYLLGWRLAEQHYKKLLTAKQKKKQARARRKKQVKKRGAK